VLLVAILFGYSIMHLGKAGQQVHCFVEECSHIFFAMMNTIMKAAPLGAGGAMAFTIGKYGIGALKPLAC
jgi:aerobic C4-dicarboxylate transport protein